MITSFVKLKNTDFYKYTIILITIAATLLIAIESAKEGGRVIPYTLQFERVLFGLLTIDFFFPFDGIY